MKVTFVGSIRTSIVAIFAILTLAACSSSSGGDGGAECGNGQLESGEACDGTELGGATCESEGFSGGAIACNDDCTLDTSACTGTPQCTPACDAAQCQECVDGSCESTCAADEECVEGSCQTASPCGNGAIDEGEDCDGTELGGETCDGLGYDGGTLACDDTCAFDVTGCGMGPRCGDGFIDPDEDCDGDQLDDVTCELLGYDGGELACDDDCAYDESGCFMFCGNGAIDEGEDCDGEELDGETCEGLGFESGTLACGDTCLFDTSGCVEPDPCGNGAVDVGEDCDGTELDGETCETLGFDGGALACDDFCAFDLTGCTLNCGNGSLDAGEDCDGTELGGLTCLLLGYDGGDLACADDCQFDTTSCTGADPCGNGDINALEDCDGGNLDGESCESLGYDEGTLACTGECQFDVTACILYCGNGAIDDNEDCDGALLGGVTCELLQYEGGTLTCGDDCQFDVSACTGPAPCGNNIVDDGEECDGMELDGETCEGLGFDTGTLDCDDSCNYDTSGCAMNCGNGAIDDGEQCDGAELDGETCESLGFDTGTLACNDDCTVDDTGCVELCGNGSIDADDEECDGADLGETTCRTLGLYGYDLACGTDCTFDLSTCSETFECELDPFEPNDTTETATAIDEGTYELTMCTDGDPEEDVFAVDLLAGDTIYVALLFEHALMDIDLSLYDADDNELEYSWSVSDNEEIAYTITVDGTYYIWAFDNDTAPSPAPYTLVVDINPECLSNADCDTEAGELCHNRVCIVPECLANADCTGQDICVDYACVTVACAETTECPDGYVCDTGAGSCAECVTSGDCPDAVIFSCEASRCVLDCTDDLLEPNDTIDTAYPLFMPVGEVGLRLCGEFGADWFEVYLESDTVYQVDALFTDADGDINVGLFPPDAMTVDDFVAGGDSTTDNESFLYAVPPGAAGDYFVGVGLVEEGFFEQTYDLAVVSLGPVECRIEADCPVGETCTDYACVEMPCAVDDDCDGGDRCWVPEGETSGLCVDCFTTDDCSAGWLCNAGRCFLDCAEDGKEENDSFDEATALPLGAFDFSLCNPYGGEEDWYFLEVPNGSELTVRIDFSDAALDLDVRLLDAGEQQLDSSSSTGDTEIVQYANDTGAAVNVYYRVFPFSDRIGGVAYRLAAGVDVACSVDADCTGEREVCEDLACVQKECLIDDDCPVDDLCIDYACFTPECLENADCALGQACQNYVCVDTTCEFSEQCPTGLVCDTTNGFCVPCVSNDDCSASQICDGNRCVYPPCTPDAWEENDDLASSANVAAGFYDLTLCNAEGGETDWFSVLLSADDQIIVEITYPHAQVDVDARLKDAGGATLDSSGGTTGTEVLEYTVTTEQFVFIEIYPFLDRTANISYSMLVVVNPACVEDTECGEGFICEGYECIAGCREDADCTGDDVCFGLGCITPECLGNEDCALGEACVDYACMTTSCTVPADCETYGLVCDDVAGYCVECLTDADCPDVDAFDCNANRCVTACVEDGFEPNGTPEAAAGLQIPVAEMGLTLCGEADEDWFALVAQPSTRYQIEVLFTHADGDIDVALYAPDDTVNELTGGFSSDDNESFIVPSPAEGGQFLLQILDYTGTYQQTYDLNITALGPVECLSDPDCAVGSVCVDYACVATSCSAETDTCDADYGLICDTTNGYCVECLANTDCPNEVAFACTDGRCVLDCTEDGFEPNDTAATAATLALDVAEVGLTLCGQDEEDWYALTLAPNTIYDFELLFSDAISDVDMRLYAADDTSSSVASSTSISDNESFRYVTDGAGGDFLLKVYHFSAYAVSYDMNITAAGAVECSVDEDCTTPGDICVSYVCQPPPPGDSCDAPWVVDANPFTVTDVDILLFNADLAFADSSCTGYGTGGRDAVFAVTVAAGQTIDATATATYDGAIYIIEDCSVLPLPAGACLAGADDTFSGDPESVSYTSPSGGTYFVVVDYYSTGPSSGTFDLTIDVTGP